MSDSAPEIRMVPVDLITILAALRSIGGVRADAPLRAERTERGPAVEVS